MIIDARFECVSKYAGQEDLLIPKRATGNSAGYDLVVAEDTIVRSAESQFFDFERKYQEYAISKYETWEKFEAEETENGAVTMARLKAFCKLWKTRPTLVPTGVKVAMPSDYYLQLQVRSSLPLNSWLVLANGVGVIDSDYYNNPDNEGHIFIQLINLHPCDIILHKGERIAQGIFLPYGAVNNDVIVETDRTGGLGSTGTNA